jgi:hypothetical protein
MNDKTMNTKQNDSADCKSAPSEKPLVDKKYLLEKFPCKGGWTFTEIPETLPDKNSPFSWVKVKGSIDGFEIGNYHLMPSGKGTLFLSVKADIRKKIKKEAGLFTSYYIQIMTR